MLQGHHLIYLQVYQSPRQEKYLNGYYIKFSSTKTFVVDAQQKRLKETLLLSTHYKYFDGKMRKKIFWYRYRILSWDLHGMPCRYL